MAASTSENTYGARLGDFGDMRCRVDIRRLVFQIDDPQVRRRAQAER